jgi:hypothetical protein
MLAGESAGGPVRWGEWLDRVLTAAATGLLCVGGVTLVGAATASSHGAHRADSYRALPQRASIAHEDSRGGVSMARPRHRDLAQATLRRRWLESPHARAQRAASRTAFRDLSSAAAQALLVRDYGRVLASESANPAASLQRQGHIVGYLGNDRAIVDTPHGRVTATSTVPLRAAGASGNRQPVDLRLRASGDDFIPVAPLTAASIAGDSAGGVAVGSDGLRIAVEGANVTGRQVGGQSVFFADVGPDTDATVTPTLRGVDLSALIRSPASPETKTPRRSRQSARAATPQAPKPPNTPPKSNATIGASRSRSPILWGTKRNTPMTGTATSKRQPIPTAIKRNTPTTPTTN